MDRGAWWATTHGATNGWVRLRLSMHAHMHVHTHTCMLNIILLPHSCKQQNTYFFFFNVFFALQKKVRGRKGESVASPFKLILFESFKRFPFIMQIYIHIIRNYVIVMACVRNSGIFVSETVG